MLPLRPVAAAVHETSAAPAVDMSEDQVSALMAAFGGAETPASPLAGLGNAAPPILPADQSALLLQSFGIAGHAYGVPEATAPAPAAAEPEKTKEAADTAPAAAAAADTGRFFPASPGRKVASLDAADTYLVLIKNMERNLARYGVR